MTKLSRVSREDLGPDLAEMHDSLTAVDVDARFIEAGANAPEVLDWYFNSFYQTLFYGGRVDTKTKEILRLKLSKMHGCVL